LRKKVFLLGLFLLGLSLFAACGTARVPAGTLRLGSDFPPGRTIPRRYFSPGAGGKNLSPPLRWSGVPAGTESFALTVEDLSPVANDWAHWLVVNIPGRTRSLPAGASGTRALPPGARELVNSFGYTGYGGPEPPAGTGRHPYLFTLYALRVRRLNLPLDAGLAGLRAALSGKVLARAEFTGYAGD